MRIEKFGAFVHLFNKTDALVHISELAWKHTEHVEDVVKVGDMVTVKIIKIDEKGRVDASIKTLLPKPEKMKTGKMEKSIVTAVVLIINQTIIVKVWKHRKKVMNQKRKNK